MKRRAALRVLGVAGLASLAAACQIGGPVDTAPTAAPTDEPTPLPTVAPTEVAVMPGLRLAIDQDPDTLDPAGQTNPIASSIVEHLAETLVRLQPDGSIAAGLARKFTQSTDGKTFTFELRPDVEFHDGAQLDAEAAALSLNRFLDPRLRVSMRAPFDSSLVADVSPLDPLTLRITLKDRSRLFLQKLAATELAIVSPAHARAFPDSYNEEPVGTGPYRFKERRKGESVVLERFDGYWGKRATYPALQFRIVPEVATRESLLLANQVEVMIDPPLSDLPTLQNNPALKIVQTPTARSTFIAMDLTLPGGTPLAIKKVRQALNFAIDRDGIIRNVLFGAATPLDAPMASTLVGYSRVGGYGYDPNRARQLLLEGGTPQLQLKMLYPTGRSVQETLFAQLAQAVAGNLHDVGVDTELIGADWATFLAAINVPADKGTAHMHLFNWAPALLDASQQMTQFVRAQWPPAGLATSHYWNPRVELLVSEAAREADDQRRQDEYAEAQRVVWDDAPWVFLWSPSFLLVHSAKVQGVTAQPTEKFSAANAEPVA
ncbi:MAG: ABC transporter substrate-binding protein [Chloroflexi bacterium]|nr:ABC transporter substrate-binding protein [Chloroflexota bacterium]MBV9596997.1 ABC transporter substrate-binding protein [Chloroflexota bacterium]